MFNICYMIMALATVAVQAAAVLPSDRALKPRWHASHSQSRCIAVWASFGQVSPEKFVTSALVLEDDEACSVSFPQQIGKTELAVAAYLRMLSCFGTFFVLWLTSLCLRVVPMASSRRTCATLLFVGVGRQTESIQCNGCRDRRLLWLKPGLTMQNLCLVCLCNAQLADATWAAGHSGWCR